MSVLSCLLYFRPSPTDDGTPGMFHECLQCCNVCAFSKNQIERPWYRRNDTEERNEKARRAYQALMTVTLRKPDSKAYHKFSEEVKRRARKLYGDHIYGKEEVGARVTRSRLSKRTVFVSFAVLVLWGSHCLVSLLYRHVHHPDLLQLPAPLYCSSSSPSHHTVSHFMFTLLLSPWSTRFSMLTCNLSSIACVYSQIHRTSQSVTHISNRYSCPLNPTFLSLVSHSFHINAESIYIIDTPCCLCKFDI